MERGRGGGGLLEPLLRYVCRKSEDSRYIFVRLGTESLWWLRGTGKNREVLEETLKR